MSLKKAMARKPKEQTVTLVVPKHGLSQEFGIQHAERLLDMGAQKNGGWELPADSKYRYDEENGLRVKTDKAID
jgi:hypothetical protein